MDNSMSTDNVVPDLGGWVLVLIKHNRKKYRVSSRSVQAIPLGNEGTLVIA